MSSIREIRRKIKSVKQTQQVTKAMKMIAASRLKRAQQQLLASRPYAQKVSELVATLKSRLTAADLAKQPLLAPRPEPNDRLILLLTSDKGLCGSYNVALLRFALKHLEELRRQNINVHFCVIGRKGRDFLNNHQFSIDKEYVNFLRQPSFSQAEILAKDCLERYLNSPEIGQIDVIYMDFRSVLRQIPAIHVMLPPQSPITIDQSPTEYIYEPAQEEILQELLPRYIKTELYRLIFEAYTSEQASRMNVMENATKNARDMIDQLTLAGNKVRQSAITREILEVVSGAEALS